MWSVPHIPPSDVVFMTGAGISANAPTNGPIGSELTIRALSHAFLSGTLGQVQLGYKALGLGQERMPRLEAILEIAARVHGPGILDDLLSDLRTAEPNDLHRFFGSHALTGGMHVTANFDVAIERAAPDSAVLHFHGSLGAETIGLGATLSRIERGFSETMSARLMEVLAGSPGRTLVVAGYSGLDYFDMDPFIDAHRHDLRAALARVIWIDHRSGASDFVETTAPGPPMLTALRNAGVACSLVRADTASVLNVFAMRWGFVGLGPQRRDETKWTARSPLNTVDRAEATRQLYLHMGMYASHERLVNRVSHLQERVGLGDRAAVAWEQGRYRAARRDWIALYSGPGVVNQARRLERTAACTWVSGAYLRGYATALQAVRAGRKSDDPEVLALCLELQARILVHMARLPDLRWFATVRRRSRVAEELHRVIDSNKFGSGLRPRFLDAIALLRNDPERLRGGPLEASATAPIWSESYLQYESLSGALNHQRGEMRRAVATGAARMTRTWLDDYLRSAAFLGKWAAVRTAPSMPGAARHFDWLEGVSLLWRAGAVPWHRLRLVTAFTAHRVKAKLSRAARASSRAET